MPGTLKKKQAAILMYGIKHVLKYFKIMQLQMVILLRKNNAININRTFKTDDLIFILI